MNTGTIILIVVAVVIICCCFTHRRVIKALVKHEPISSLSTPTAWATRKRVPTLK